MNEEKLFGTDSLQYPQDWVDFVETWQTENKRLLHISIQEDRFARINALKELLKKRALLVSNPIGLAFIRNYYAGDMYRTLRGEGDALMNTIVMVYTDTLHDLRRELAALPTNGGDKSIGDTRLALRRDIVRIATECALLQGEDPMPGVLAKCVGISDLRWEPYSIPEKTIETETVFVINQFREKMKTLLS